MAEMNDESTTRMTPGGSSITSIKAAEDMEDAKAITQNYLVQRLPRLLLMEPSTFEVNTPAISSYGLNRMIGAEFRDSIFSRVQDGSCVSTSLSAGYVDCSSLGGNGGQYPRVEKSLKVSSLQENRQPSIAQSVAEVVDSIRG